MNKKTWTLLICVFATLSIQAQEGSFSQKLGLGFQLTQHQRDFGLGLNFTSPQFFHQKMAIRLRGNLLWNEHLDEDNETIWTPYSNVSLGLVGFAGEVSDFLRLYGEGGMVALFPSSDFSGDDLVLGGYGLLGFEFFMDPKNNYFIELGGVGTGASADKIPGNPIYSNGFLMNVGYRHQF